MSKATSIVYYRRGAFGTAGVGNGGFASDRARACVHAHARRQRRAFHSGAAGRDGESSRNRRLLRPAIDGGARVRDASRIP